MISSRARYLTHMPLGPEALELTRFDVEDVREAECSGLELRAPEKQLRSCAVGEREGGIDSEAEAHRLEDAPLCLHFAKDSPHQCILSQIKFQDARKKWRGICDPACLYQ